MEYNNGLVFIEIKTKSRFNRKNTEHLQKMMEEAVEQISDFIDLCCDMKMRDDDELPMNICLKRHWDAR